MLALVLIAAAATSEPADWEQTDLVLTLGLLTIASHMFPLDARGVHVSGSFIGLVLAMALLGPAPAVAIGVTAVLLDALRTRPPLWHLATDLVTYATFPLVGGLLFEAVHEFEPNEEAAGFALAVGVVFMVTNLLNFVLVVVQTKLHRPETPGLIEMAKANFLPVLPWQVATATVTAVAAYAEVRVGQSAIGVLVLVLVVFRLLLRAVLDAELRRDQLVARLEELDEMHQGILWALLQTLGLRDRMTARHSGAVSRYALAVAAEAGMSVVQQDLAHTAGLLHDIGKSCFDDELLRTPGPLTDAQKATIRRHPDEGARILSAVRGYREVATIVRHHHERWDGTGYPAGLAGDDIPELSRVISVADTYDVMTARDSYRHPVSHEEAVAELRRVAGSQLDARYVELFITVVERGGVAFGHADDRDLEAELITRANPWRVPPADLGGEGGPSAVRGGSAPSQLGTVASSAGPREG